MDKEPAYNWTKSTHTKLHHGGTRNPYKILKALFKYIYHNERVERDSITPIQLKKKYEISLFNKNRVF